MSITVEYFAKVYDKDTGKLIEERKLYTKEVTFPKTVDDFGLRQKEQLMLIEKGQNAFLDYQSRHLDTYDRCPNCGKKPEKHALHESHFHDVFTDHKVSLRRLTCTCGWSNKFTVKGLYGKASHPELVKLQILTGSSKSFAKSSKALDQYSLSERKINNHATIRNYVNSAGKLLGDLKQTDSWSKGDYKESKHLLVTTDGGPLQNKEEGKHSFEELVTTVYRPEDIVQITPKRKEIRNKVCVGSAKKDKQKTIKQLTLNACKKMGLTTSTIVTALTDGANNCWSVIESLEGHCAELIPILDWFHVGKYFKSRSHKIPEELIDLYDKVKWHLWHGHPATALIRLEQLKQKITDLAAIEKLEEIKTYISNNKKYFTNYHTRKILKQPYTSQLAESSVSSVINERQKHQKMSWTREGAHNVLQIRTSLFSKNWENDWQFIKQEMYKEAA